MVAFDKQVLLDADPAKIPLSGADGGHGGAVAEPREDAPACQASLQSFRTASMFQVLFTSLVFVVSLAAATALVWAIYKIAHDGADAGAIITGVSGVLASGAVVFLAGKMKQSVNVAKKALADVSKYCGPETESQLR